MKGTVLANSSAIDRSKTDFYPTPSNVTIALMKYLQLPLDTIIWEPACGEGHMVNALSNFCHRVYATELFDRGFGVVGIDFLTAKLPNWIDWIITNPPFSLSEQFIRRCIDHKKPFAMLLKSQYWHAECRLKLFKEYPPMAILPLTWRPDFLFKVKNARPTMEVLWAVWGDRLAERTEYVPLVKPPGVS